MNQDNFPWGAIETLTTANVRSLRPVDARAVLADARAIQELDSRLIHLIAISARFMADVSGMSGKEILQLARDIDF